jgi:hypothetical protein
MAKRSNTADQPDDKAVALRKFEQRYKHFMSQLSDACENDNNVSAAIAIVDDAQTEEGYIIYNKGDEYQQAKLLAKLLRKLNSVILRELSTNPNLPDPRTG